MVTRRTGARFLLAGAASTLALVGCRSGGPTAGSNSIVSGGLTRTFAVHVPASYGQGRKVPLVVVLHGFRGNGSLMEQITGFDAVADKHRFIVVYPDGVGASWNSGLGLTAADRQGVDDVGFISDLIEALESRYSIDPARVYVTGSSDGGFMTESVACKLAAKVAAAAPVAGTLLAKLAPSCSPSRPISVMLINGTADPRVPYDGGSLFGVQLLSAPETAATWARLDGCGSSPSTSQVPSSVNDGTSVSVATYTGCRDGTEVELGTVHGGGHSWPGGTIPSNPQTGVTSKAIDASEVIWEFFAAHPLR